MPVSLLLHGVNHVTLNPTLMTGSMTSLNMDMEDTQTSNPRPSTGQELMELNIRIDWLRGQGELPLGVIPMPPLPQDNPYKDKPENKPWGY